MHRRASHGRWFSPRGFRDRCGHGYSDSAAKPPTLRKPVLRVSRIDGSRFELNMILPIWIIIATAPLRDLVRTQKRHEILCDRPAETRFQSVPHGSQDTKAHCDTGGYTTSFSPATLFLLVGSFFFPETLPRDEQPPDSQRSDAQH